MRDASRLDRTAHHDAIGTPPSNRHGRVAPPCDCGHGNFAKLRRPGGHSDCNKRPSRGLPGGFLVPEPAVARGGLLLGHSGAVDAYNTTAKAALPRTNQGAPHAV